MKKIMSVLLAAASAAALMLGCSGGSEETPAMQGSSQLNAEFSQDVRMYEQALAQDPNNLDILVQIGNKYYDWGVEEIQRAGEMAQPGPKWTRAIEYYRRALDIDPDNANVRTDMANLIQWLGGIDEAIEEYRKAKESDPMHPQSRTNLVIMLGKAKQDYKGAIKEYEEMIKLMPEQKNNIELKNDVDGYRALLKESKK